MRWALGAASPNFVYVAVTSPTLQLFVEMGMSFSPVRPGGKTPDVSVKADDPAGPCGSPARVSRRCSRSLGK